MGVTHSKVDVLQRFAAADSALRRVHEELSAVAVARAGAEGAAGSLAAAADAVAEFAHQVQTATLSALDVQDGARAALEEMRVVSRAFDVSTLLNELRSIRQEFGEMNNTLAGAADRVHASDARVAALQACSSETAASTASLASRVDGMEASIGRQLAAGIARVCAVVEAGRSEARVDAARHDKALQVAADDTGAATRNLTFLLAGMESRLGVAIGEVGSAAEGQISGIVDALPRRSKRRLGLQGQE